MAQELNKVMGMVCERERYYYNAKKVDAVLAEKDATIAELKQQLESVQASMYTDLVDAPDGERRWRKCSQELPEDNRVVLGVVIRTDKSYYYTLNYRSRGAWVKSDYPEYWMPLPHFEEVREL